ncbi:cysteine hydrolase family protein [Teredinibacter haidensis]|uniref:cysteine hydrolase family protein n=1 Tax=Teredinibacter haidensis TaxID=2731755 RepID=UPI000A43903F|nr:isochorismatase family protein [Teredinibacter haidensis]
MKNTALIVIDIQNDYFPGGALTLDGVSAAAEKASQLIRMFRSHKLPVIHIQHENTKPEMEFMLPGSFGQGNQKAAIPKIIQAYFGKRN